MQVNTNNPVNETNNDNPNADASGNNGTNTTNDGVDAAFTKHLDIAIEAQDARAETKAPATEDGKPKEPSNQQSSTGDPVVQPDGQGKDPAIAEAARTLARAKDITLPDGSVVKGGPERRFYEQRETARQQFGAEQRDHQATRQKLQQVETELNTIRETTTALHGMDPNAVRLGATIVKDLQRDPVGTMKKLLAETVAQGYNIEDIGAGVDAAAIQRMLDERIPKNNAADNAPTEQQIVAEATNEVNEFYGSFPDARPHDSLIARVLQDYPKLSLRDVYFQLKDSFAEKGLDWSRSLQDNMKEVSQQQPNAHNQQHQPNAHPLPNGRGNDGEFKLNANGSANEDQDTADIVRQAMRESGMNI